MEINGKQPLVSLDSGVQRLDTLQKAAPRTSKADFENQGRASDRVELSIRGLQFQHFEELVRAVPDIREAKVEQIRNAIQAGTYNVKGEQVADKILSGSLIDEVF